MMGTRAKLKSGEEYDMLTRARKYFHSDKHRSKNAKRRFNRRMRREAKENPPR